MGRPAGCERAPHAPRRRHGTAGPGVPGHGRLPARRPPAASPPPPPPPAPTPRKCCSINACRTRRVWESQTLRVRAAGARLARRRMQVRRLCGPGSPRARRFRRSHGRWFAGLSGGQPRARTRAPGAPASQPRGGGGGGGARRGRLGQTAWECGSRAEQQRSYCTRTHTHAHTRTHARMHTHARTQTHTHTCTHMHTHTHTHTQYYQGSRTPGCGRGRRR